MRPVAISGENAQYEIVLDGFGNRRRRGIGTQAEAVVLAKAGVIAGQDQLLVLEDPGDIDAFRAIPEVGLGGPPVLADVGALKLAVETWNRVEGLKVLLGSDREVAPTPADRQALVDAVRRIGQEIGGVADQLDK